MGVEISVIPLPPGVKTVYQVLRDNGYYVISSKGKNDFNFVFSLEDLYDSLASANMGFGGPDWRKRPEGRPFFAQIQLKGGKNNGRYKGAVATTDAAKPARRGKKARAANTGPFTDRAKVTVPPYYPDVPIIREEYAHHYDTIRHRSQVARQDAELQRRFDNGRGDGDDGK